MTESENENDHFDLDHFDHIWRAPSLLTLAFLETWSQRGKKYKG